MTYTGFNFRSTLAGPSGFPGDPANTTFVGQSAYSAGVGFGYTGSITYHGENAGWVTWPKLCGGAGQSQWNTPWRVDLPQAGNFNFRIALGSFSPPGISSALIWDGAWADGATVIGPGNFTAYAPSTQYPAGKYTVVGDKLYKATHDGTTGSNSPPSGTGSAIVDGSVTWAWVRTALASVSGTTATSTSVLDATGTSYDRSAWEGSNTPGSFTTTQNFVSITRGYAGYGNIHHFAYEPILTQLVDLTFEDQFGQATSTPGFYANEAPGTPLFRIKATAGSIGVANVSFTGPLATYLVPQVIGGKTWACVGNTRIPDSLAGTRSVGVVQTDGSPTISGSPRTTTINATVTSSGGRNTSDTSIYGLISTQAAIIRQTVDTAFSTGLWPGYTGQTILEANDFAVSSRTSLEKAWSQLQPDLTSWYRIRLQNGDYSGKPALGNKDFGTGGVLWEPDAGHDPCINFAGSQWLVNRMHWRNFRFATAGTSGYAIQFVAGTTFFNVVKMENLRVGYMFSDGNPQETDIPANALAFFLMRHGQSLEIDGCTFDGTSGSILPFNVRCLKITNNTVQRCTDDFIACGMSMYINDIHGVFPDDNVYLRIKNNTRRNELDYAGYANNAHIDFCQLRPWQAGNSPYGAYKAGGLAWAVGNQTFNAGNWYSVSAITTGVAGGTAPTHTSGTMVDGGVTWQYGGSFNANRAFYIDVDTNYQHSLKTQSLHSANTQFLFDSQKDYGIPPWTLYAAVYNNFESSPSTYGVSLNMKGILCVEYNTLCGPSAAGPDLNLDTLIQAVDAGSRLWTRGNVSGTTPTSTGLLADFNNVAASFRSANPSPGASLIGTFTANGGQWTFPLSSALTDSGQLLRRTMRQQLLAKTGLNAGCIPAPAQTLNISFDMAGGGATGSAAQSLVLEPY